MNHTSLLVLSLGLSLGFAFAEDESTYTGLYLASGLSEENGVISGWYDAEKTQAEDMDDSMCYAASASNLIAWWQNSEYALASEAPKELDVIWNTFVSNNLIQDAGGSPLSAINWWISGVYTPEGMKPGLQGTTNSGTGITSHMMK